MPDRVLGNASSPVSAIEAIEPAERIWAYTNGRGLRVWTPMMPALAGLHEEQEYVHSDLHAALARQAEALQRENAELREALQNLMGCYDTPISRRRFPPDDFMKEALDIARALLGGSEHAE